MFSFSVRHVKWKMRTFYKRLLRVKIRNALLFLVLVSVLLYCTLQALTEISARFDHEIHTNEFSAPSWHDGDLLIKLSDTCYIPRPENYVFKPMKFTHMPKAYAQDDFAISGIKYELVNHANSPILKLDIQRDGITCFVHEFRVGQSNSGGKDVYPARQIFETSNSQDIIIPKGCNHFRVQCRSALTPDERVIYENYHSVIGLNERAKTAVRHWKRRLTIVGAKTRMPADILLIGVDSLSRSILQNRLPNLHKYLQDKSPFVEMKGFLSYGVSPHSSMFPFLAAGEKIPVEFLNVSSPIDPSDRAMTSTMKILEGLRYVTFYGEDVNHRISAISNPAETRPHPFEFNLDTTYNINDIILATKVSNEMGSFHRSSTSFMLNYTLSLLDYFDQRAPVAALLWLKIANNGHLRKAALDALDTHLVTILKKIVQRKKKRAMIILFGNRGHWGLRAKKFEELLDQRLPALYMSVPNLQIPMLYNSDRIVAPTDIWRTVLATARRTNLTSLLRLTKDNNSHELAYDLTTEIIPTTRGCEEAGVRGHVCPCSKSSSFSPRDSYVTSKFIALKAIEKMNKDLRRSSNSFVCQELLLRKVKDLVVFNLARDNQIFRLLFTITAVPKAHYSAIVNFDPKSKSVQFPCRYDWVERHPPARRQEYKCLRNKTLSVGCHYPTQDAIQGVGMLRYLRSICYCV